MRAGTKPVSIIAAVADDMGIGFRNKLPWHIPSDMKWFMKTTAEHTVIMGSATFMSLPGGALKNRRNIVLTRGQRKFEGAMVVHSMDEALELCDEGKENFVIGGASVYRQFLPLAQKLYLTLIHQKFNADAFFPAIQPEEWEEIFRQPGEEKDPNLLFEFIILQRKHYL